MLCLHLEPAYIAIGGRHHVSSLWKKVCLLCLCALVFGCGGGQSVLGSDPPSAPSPDGVIVGKVFLGSTVPDTTVRLIGPGGELMAQEPTNPSGTFMFKGFFPKTFRLETTVGGETFGRAAQSSEEFCVINVPNTMVSRLVQSGMSVADAREQVRLRLGMASADSLDVLEESVSQPFSHVAFFVVALQNGGVEAFSSQLSEGVIPLEEPLVLRADKLDAGLDGLDAQLAALLEPVRRDPFQRRAVHMLFSRGFNNGATGSFSGRAIRAKGLLGAVGSLLGFVGEGIATSVLDSGIESSYTWLAQKLGWHYGTGPELSEILDTVEQINAGVQQLLTDVDVSRAQAIGASVTADTQAIDDAMVTMYNTIDAVYPLKNGQRQVSPPTYFNNLPASTQLPTVTAYEQNLAASKQITDFEGYLIDIQKILTGGAATPPPTVVSGNNTRTNLIAALRQSTLADEYGFEIDSGAARFALFPVRSSAYLDDILCYYEYYTSYLSEASLILAQAASSSPQLVVSLQSVRQRLDDNMRSVQNARSQLPGYPPSDDILIDLQYGLMWYLPLQSATSLPDAQSQASKFSLALSNGQTYTGWRLATFNEMVALQQRGYYTQTANASYSNVVEGLASLGFDFDCNGDGTDDIASDGAVWCDNWVYETPLFGADYWTNTTSTVLIYNLNNDLINFRSGQTANLYPYLMVRTIANPLIKIDPPGLPGEQDTWPASLYSTISAWETPYLGVFVAFANQAYTSTQVSTQAQYQVNLGGSFKLGSEGSDSVETYAQTFTTTILPFPFISIDNDLVARISNFPQTWGRVWESVQASAQTTVRFHAVGYQDGTFPAQITGTVQTAPGTPAVSLTQLQISPRNLTLDVVTGGVVEQDFTATAFTSDTNVNDVTSLVQWKVVSTTSGMPDPGASFSNSRRGALVVDTSLLVDPNLTITATLGAGSDETDVLVQPPNSK